MKYLNRALITGPYYALCLDEKIFKSETKRLGIESPPEFCRSGADASTHYLEHPKHGLVCLVCFRKDRKHTKIQQYALLVHEAVHIWRAWRESVGEKDPSSEFEAYAIQAISQSLMEAFDRR